MPQEEQQQPENNGPVPTPEVNQEQPQPAPEQNNRPQNAPISSAGSFGIGAAIGAAGNIGLQVAFAAAAVGFVISLTGVGAVLGLPLMAGAVYGTYKGAQLGYRAIKNNDRLDKTWAATGTIAGFIGLSLATAAVTPEIDIDIDQGPRDPGFQMQKMEIEAHQMPMDNGWETAKVDQAFAMVADATADQGAVRDAPVAQKANQIVNLTL